MAHAHLHVPVSRVLAATAVTIGAAAFEAMVATGAGSLFLVADSLHLVAHLGIFAVLMLPSRASHHESKEDFATLAVLGMVLLISAGICYQSVTGLAHEAPPPSPLALLASLAGLAANFISAWLFRDPAEHRWSFRAALAHELSDAGLTLAGLVGAGAIALWHFTWVDPGLSLVITGWLMFWAGRLLWRRVRLGRDAWDTNHAAHADHSDHAHH